MKILWVVTRFLFPLNSGGKIRSFNIIKGLINFHEITLISFAKNEDEKYFGEIEKVIKSYKFIKFNETAKETIKFYFELILNIFFSLPFVIKKYQSKKMKNIIVETLAHDKHDLIVCDFLTSSINLDLNINMPKVIFQHNAETLIWERAYKEERSLFKKIYFFIQFFKMKIFEKRILKKFDLCIAVSSKDKEYFINKFGLKNVRVIPTGVDVRYFIPRLEMQQENTLVYVGNINWFPTEDALSYFIKEILPLIKKECNSLKLYIVGLGPVKKVFSLAKKDNNIIVTGTVDDVREYINLASVFILPLRIGGGTRIKIYEAMASAKAIVSTSIGAEGLEVENNKNIILADTKESFASSVIQLLKDKELRIKIGSEARKYVEENCAWDKVVDKFSEYCENAIVVKKDF
jgi:glycosyltransferase involved in cell wall biosynthesis